MPNPSVGKMPLHVLTYLRPVKEGQFTLEVNLLPGGRGLQLELTLVHSARPVKTIGLSASTLKLRRTGPPPIDSPFIA